MTIKEGQVRLAEAMLRPVNPTAIILLGVFTIAWGFWVGNPFWNVFTHARLYSFMNFAPEPVWGLIAAAAGVVISHGAVTKRVGALILGAKTGGLFWLLVSIFFFMGDWMNTGGITALILSIYSFFIYLNLKVNSKAGLTADDLFVK